MRRPAVVSRSLGEYKYGLFKGVFIDKQVPFVNWHDYVRIITYNVIPLTAHEPSKQWPVYRVFLEWRVVLRGTRVRQAQKNKTVLFFDPVPAQAELATAAVPGTKVKL